MNQMNHDHTDVMNQNSTEVAKHWKDLEDTLANIGVELNETRYLDDDIDPEDAIMSLHNVLHELDDLSAEIEEAESAMKEAENEVARLNDNSGEDTGRELEWGWAERKWKKGKEVARKAIERTKEKARKVARKALNRLKKHWQNIVSYTQWKVNHWRQIWWKSLKKFRNLHRVLFHKLRRFRNIIRNQIGKIDTMTASGFAKGIIDNIPFDNMIASGCGSVSVKFLKITMCGEQGFNKDTLHSLRKLAELMAKFMNTLISKAKELFTILEDLITYDGFGETWDDVKQLHRFIKLLGKDVVKIGGEVIDFMKTFSKDYKETMCIGVGNPNAHASLCLKRINPISLQGAGKKIVMVLIEELITELIDELKNGVENFWDPSKMVEDIVDILFRLFNIDSFWVESGLGLKDKGAIDFRFKATITEDAREAFQENVKKAILESLGLARRHMQEEKKIESDQITKIVGQQSGNDQQILYDI